MKNRKIVLIMVDSQRWDFLNCYKNTGLKTPQLDRIAAEGVRFDRAYTTQPVCQPARAAIFTGQYPHGCASWSNCMGISDNVHTVGERLQDDGVHTAYIGKWHLDGGDYFGLGKCPKGWDPEYWYDMKNFLDELTEDERRLSRRAANMKEHDFKAEDTFGHRCSDRAVDFLEKYHDEDFFLTVSYDEPHGPFICPPPYPTMYDDYFFPASPNLQDTLENKPEYQKVWAGDALNADRSHARIKAPYFFGANSFVDSEIGRVLDAIDTYAPDALVIYTSDHGDMLQSHRLSAKGPAGYDEITRIPFMMKGPGIDAGVVDTRPVSHINIVPTILDLMGVEIPPVIDGKSLVPQLNNGERVNPYVYIEFGRYEVDHDGFGGLQLMRSIFDGRYKLNINLLSTDEFYDLQEDPDEMVNLIDDPATLSIREEMHDQLLDEMYRTRDPFRGYYWRNRHWREPITPDWKDRRYTRQREESERYEHRQLDYSTGMPMEEAVRFKS